MQNPKEEVGSPLSILIEDDRQAIKRWFDRPAEREKKLSKGSEEF